MADFKDELFPALKFHFRVTVDGEQISFSEVSGLDMETEVVEYRHGDDEFFGKMKSAGLRKVSNITLKKGVFEGDDRIGAIFNRLNDKDYYTQYDSRFEMLIELLSETGDTVYVWNVTNAFPSKFSGTDLKSDGNEVAMETLEIAAEDILAELA
jgi:phage tail-like protein